MKNGFKITLLALAVTSTLAPMLAAPAVKLLMLDFTEVNTVLIQLVVTFASFFILPSLLIGNLLSRWLSKKTLLVIGLLLYVIGGVGPAFMNSIGGILTLRAVLGLGIGFITPLMNAIVAEYFEGEERSKMNGLTVGVNGLGGAFFLIIGGAITALGWRGVFWTYSFGIVLLIMVLAFVPSGKSVTTIGVGETASNEKLSLPVGVYAVGLLTTGLMVLYYVIPTNLASFVVDNHLGNSATSGYLTAVSFVFVFLAGIVGTKLQHVLRKGSVAFILFLFGAAFLMLGEAHNLWMVAAAVGIVGFGFGFAYPILLNKMAIVATAAHRTLAIMLMTAFANVGQFISPLITNGIRSALYFNSIRGVLLLVGGLVTGLFVVSVIRMIVNKKELAHA
ncbi:MFS transporter [Paenibacillus glycanilyticus]|uniref:MFS transporter n=1 Tax=Paenibacillus glycanilyticus TaxID=126569 RepID=UPI00203DE8C8|nr:MFS transporter [Paenibacillus glycanilyticus]MCM3627070.1 MFS transporter [Paenibacillus glycanilyticus]